ncbi:AI-2E family transporter [Solidesulfovibrio sp.]|uniref:AI-2E family transporter n=1 Tax=Solidesulfovibrio sp. TaxID=2910990 RepID=UPI002620961E|nr:AI-2E family transporter [Solidesulfovibrio sp.]
MAQFPGFYRPFLLAIFVAAISIMATLLWPFRHAMVLALVLATLMHPLRARLPRPVRTRRFLAATTLTLLTILFVLLPLAGLVTLLTSEAVTFIHTAIAWFKTGGLVEAVVWVRARPLPDWAKSYLDASSIDLRKIEVWALSSGGDIGLWFLSAGKGIANIGLQLLVLVMFLFYLLAEGERLTELLRKASPLRRAQEDAIIARFKAVSQAVLLGGLGTSVAIGVVTGIGLRIAGISPVLWGAVAVIASLIPVVGLSLIMIPALVYLVATDSVKMAVFLALYWLVAVSSVDNVVRPLFMRGTARMSLVWVFVSIVGGVLMFGPLGLLYGPLALSISFLFLEIFFDAQNETDDAASPEA